MQSLLLQLVAKKNKTFTGMLGLYANFSFNTISKHLFLDFYLFLIGVEECLKFCSFGLAVSINSELKLTSTLIINASFKCRTPKLKTVDGLSSHTAGKNIFYIYIYIINSGIKKVLILCKK